MKMPRLSPMEDEYCCEEPDCEGVLKLVEDGMWGVCLTCGMPTQVHCCAECMKGE